MTSAGRPDRERPTVRAPIVAARDFPDGRSTAQLRVDRERARQQVEGLASARSVGRTREIVEQIRTRQERAPRRHALPFDVYRLPDNSDPEAYALVARGQLVVRLESPNGLREAADDDEGAARMAADRESRQLDELRRLGYVEHRVPAKDVLRPSQDDRTRVYASKKGPEELARDCRELWSRGVNAAMNLIVPLGHLIKGDDYPFGTTGLAPAPTGKPARRVRVAVVDTGITSQPRDDGWLGNVQAAADDFDLLDVVPELGRLDWCSGHGTFAAGIVQQVAPLCEIVMYRCTHSDGLGTEKDVADALIQAAREGHEAGVPTIINASLGTPAVPDMPLVALQAAVELITSTYPEVLIVASAGNNGTSEPMYPAAFDGVVAVGAVEVFGLGNEQGLRPAAFSNHGPWVRCSTVGVGVVSTFVQGLEPPQATPQHPDELFPANAVASWSGTSFSAPQISGAVARLCYDDPALTPRTALDALLAGHDEIPGYGTVVRLLPGTSMP